MEMVFYERKECIFRLILWCSMDWKMIHRTEPEAGEEGDQPQEKMRAVKSQCKSAAYDLGTGESASQHR